jgi:hypothetical protein
MVSHSQHQIATKYIQEYIPVNLGEISLWVQSGAGSVSAEQKHAIRETLDFLEARLRRVITFKSMCIRIPG